MARRWFRSQTLATGRVEALSDGVIAVAITLLALDLKLPPDLASDAEIWRAARALLPGLGAWAISFAFILTIWINHHFLFAGLKLVDRGLMWLNGYFLLTVTLIPLPTGLVAAYPGRAAPLALLSGTMMFASASFTFMRLYLLRRPELSRATPTRAETRALLIRSALGPMLYGAALAAAFVNPLAAIALQVAALLLFVFGLPNFSRAGAEAAFPGETES